jgi:GT2 family glycosyltransferase
MKIDKKELGIVILNYNNYIDTINLVKSLCLKSVLESTHIVVVDNKSTDNSFSNLKELKNLNSNIHVIQSNSNLGYANGNNIGLNFLDKFNINYVAIINNDVIIEDELLFSKLISEFKEIKNLGFIAPVEIDSNGAIKQYCARKKPSFLQEIINTFLLYVYLFPKTSSYEINEKQSKVEVDILSGAFLFTSFKFFKKIGFFDPGTFLFLEERIISEKVSKLGLKQYILPKLNYKHKTSESINKKFSNIEQQKIYNKSLIYYLKNYSNNGAIKSQVIRVFLQFKILQFKIYNSLKIN